MVESQKLAAILVADIVGFSRMAGADEPLTLARLRTLHSDLVDPTISVNNGRIFKKTGDGLLVEFRSVVDAVKCAIEIQQEMVQRNAGVAEDRRIVFRIGIHLGDVSEEPNGDLLGNGVNIAARLEAIADPGGVCVSQAAYESVRGKLKLEFIDLGERELKNIVHPVRVYSVKASTESTDSQLSDRKKRSSIGASGTIIFGTIYVGFLIWMSWGIIKPWLDKVKFELFPNSRIFVDVSPAYLASLYKDRMTLQVDKLFDDYVGKWMLLSGNLRDVQDRGLFGDVFVTVEHQSPEYWLLSFDSSWKDQLSIIPRGKSISAECQIDRAEATSVFFRAL